MNLNQQLTEKASAALAPLMDLSRVDYCVMGDLTSKRRYGWACLVVAGGKVAVCDGDGAAFALALSDIKEAKVDELFGGGALVAVTPSGEKTLIAYTKACVPEFAVMARVIDSIANGRQPEVPDDEQQRILPAVRRAAARSAAKRAPSASPGG